MKRRIIHILTGVLIIAGIYACTKDSFNPQGGLIPTNYIAIHADSISPDVMTVESGSSITFLNQDEVGHNIISDDSTTIITNDIAPHTSFYWKKDTFGTFPYHDRLTPSLRGVIVITP